VTARNKPLTRAQKFDAWWRSHGTVFRTNDEAAWLAGYLAGWRACQYAGDQRGKVQRTKVRK
jgi:hypothetical protein